MDWSFEVLLDALGELEGLLEAENYGYAKKLLKEIHGGLEQNGIHIIQLGRVRRTGGEKQ